MVPKVSIVVSTFNGERHIKEAITSLLCQSLRDFELIVVNDGSTDRTVEIVRSFRDARLLLVESESNRGIAESQNEAIKIARGEYIALQDHDDLSAPGRLEMQVAFLGNNPKMELVGSECIVIDWGRKPTGNFTVPLSDIDLKWALLLHNPFLHTSVLFRRSALSLVGAYSSAAEFRYAEDYEFLSRFGAQCTVANIPQPLVKWRNYDSQTSARNLPVQERSAMNIATRNMNDLLGDRVVGSGNWFALKKLLLAKHREQIAVSEEEVYAVADLISALQAAFYRKHDFASDVIAEHRRKLSRLIGKHFVALACRRNERINLRSRSALFTLGSRLLLQRSSMGWR